MAPKSSIDRLDPEIKAYIQSMLALGSMTLDELIADLQEKFPASAVAGELPSRSAVGRYGQKLNRRLAAIRASTEAAKIIQAHAGDDSDARSEALVAMVQTELFEAILALQEVDEQPPEGMTAEEVAANRVELLSKAAKNIATLTRGSINLKQFQAQVEERTRKAVLAEQEAKLQTIAKQQGMGREQLDFWMKEFLGVRG